MSSLTTTTVECDVADCEEWETRADTAAGIEAARANAAQFGWTVRVVHGGVRDLCPGCTTRPDPTFKPHLGKDPR